MTSPLRKKEGVQYVIHVVGPNMNPERPDCLKGDYETGCKLLEESYTSFLEFYAEKLGYFLSLVIVNSQDWVPNQKIHSRMIWTLK